MKIKPFAFDAEAIYRALLNVVQNGIEACHAGCVIKIRLTTQKATAIISVIDDGEGIAAEHMRSIFKPFVSSKGHTGTGIGLPVSRKIMREHGGDITVTSSQGQGTRFTLTLPLRKTKRKSSKISDTTTFIDREPE